MKILQINTVATGCTGRIAYGIMKVAAKAGYECKFAYGRGKSADPNTYMISNPFDYNFHALCTRVFDDTGLHSVIRTKKFIKWIEEYGPDVIHLHNLHGYYINYEILFKYIKEKNIKVVWTLHDCWPYTGHCPYYTFVGCDKWRYGCSNCQQKLHHPASFLFDRSAQNYKDKKKAFQGTRDLTIVTPSAWLAGEVRKSFLGDYPIEVIPNGIDLETFHPTEMNFRKQNNLEDKIIVLGVANGWAETKGMNYFIELSELAGSEYQIILVGLTKKQLKNIPSGIIGIGKIENIDILVDLYSSADIFLNPTLEDNFPTTHIESLACGTPVITFRTGGAPEAIDGTCGLIVNEKNTQSIFEACQHLRKKDVHMQEACVSKSRQYSENNTYMGYVKLYGNI